jgi:hypothetical protein
MSMGGFSSMAYVLSCSGPFTPITCKLHLHKLSLLSLRICYCALEEGYKTYAVRSSQAGQHIEAQKVRYAHPCNCAYVS